MRFTALLVPVMITQISRITTTVGSANRSKSRMKEMWCDAGVSPRSSSSAGESARTPKTTRDHGLADHLGLAAQAQAALLGDLDEVVEEADQAHADEQEEQQQRRGRRASLWVISLASEVADHRGQDDDDAAHGGRAALGVVGGRAVVADLLAVAPAA